MLSKLNKPNICRINRRVKKASEFQANKIAIRLILFIILSANLVFADVKYNPIRFTLSTNAQEYYEGGKIIFILSITNTDTQQTYPVLLPHTHNKGPKLLYLKVYDKANNTQLLRYTEDRLHPNNTQDTGSVEIRYLKPLEQITVPICLNGTENPLIHNLSNEFQHSLGVPLFAGIYKVNVTYNPRGIALGDSIYNYYHDTDEVLPNNGKLAMSGDGAVSNLCIVRIKRSADTVITLEKQKYFIKKEADRYFYLTEDLPQITTDIRCQHITNLPPDSFSIVNEYFYSHFTDLYAEYISRFEDYDIREYRKYSDYCPDYLYTEKYNEFRQKTLYALQLPDKKFYSVTYHQPGGNIHQETYCSADGTLCQVSTYVYSKKGEFLKKEISHIEPCVEIEINGKKRSYKRFDNLEGR